MSKNTVSEILDPVEIFGGSEEYKNLSLEELISKKETFDKDFEILRKKIAGLGTNFTQDNVDWYRTGIHLSILEDLIKKLIS